MQRAEKQVLFWLSAVLLLIVAVLLLRAVLLPFVVGLAIAYFLNPLADRLEAMGLSRTAASALIIAGLVILAGAALVVLVPALLSQLQQLVMALPDAAGKLKDLAEEWARPRLGARFGQIEAGLDSAAAELAKNWSAWAGIVARSAWSQGLALFNFVSLLLVTPLVVFYLLADWHRMLAKVDSWLPRRHAPTIRRLAGDIDDSVAAFVRGQGTVCLILGVLYAVGLSLVGLNYALVIGLATGLLAFVPFVGWALGLLTAAAIALAQFWPQMLPVMLVVGVFLAGQVLDAALLSPRIVGSKIGLHPVWLIFALFVFSYLFGLVGMLVAVPVSAAIGVLVRHALRVYIGSEMYTGEDKGPGAGAAQG